MPAALVKVLRVTSFMEFKRSQYILDLDAETNAIVDGAGSDDDRSGYPNSSTRP
jgi:hypothetical protein